MVLGVIPRGSLTVRVTSEPITRTRRLSGVVSVHAAGPPRCWCVWRRHRGGAASPPDWFGARALNHNSGADGALVSLIG